MWLAGRQYFSLFRKDDDSFLWADGFERFSAEALKTWREYHDGSDDECGYEYDCDDCDEEEDTDEEEEEDEEA